MPKRVLVYFLKKFDSRLDNLDEVFTFFGRTPLHIAVLSNDIKYARKILYLEPDLASEKDNRGWTPLHLASARASLEMVELLLMARRDVCTVQDNDQRTPLHLAVMNNRVEVMEILTEEGLPKPKALHQNGETILHFCVKNNCSIETLNLLADKLDIARASNSSIINSRDHNGKTVLQLAAEMGKTEMVKYLLESNNLKREITDASFTEAFNALSPENQNDLETRFLKYNEHDNRNYQEINILSKYGDKRKWLKERVNALMVVATLIAGIAFQAAMNPPGGVWQEDSKVNSSTDPITFAYYLNNMYVSPVSGGLDSYLDYNLPYNSSSGGGGQYSFIRKFVIALMNMWWKDTRYLDMMKKGLILEDFKFTELVSNYNNNGNSSTGGNFPYLIRYAGSPVLAYTWPDIYVIYMVTNGVALFMSLIIIFLVVCGFVIEISVAQVRVLALLICISITCIASAYLSILVAMLPGFYIESERTFKRVQIFLGVCCILGVGSFIWSLVWKIVKLRKRKRDQHIGFMNYFRAFYRSMDAKAAGKLIIFVVCYFGFRLNGFVYYGTWSHKTLFFY
ncbi:hypothetical protein MKW98_000916 [Papaver atlanticum]|uniref:PGG domain-containing protein n=1 Tax=Papaver atlanticum TaxID=357466 RepID=A0AAD4SFI9_9MAGN|nr:hypothetical protein MKW98_000916 [Papaver atlanticum]